MERYGPKEGLRVCLMTERRADEHTRRIHNVPDDVGLGWKPYTILVTSYGGVAHTAFHSMRDFRCWLGRDYRINLGAAWHFPGIRSGTINARGEVRA